MTNTARKRPLRLYTRMNDRQVLDHLAELYNDRIELDVDMTHTVARARRLGLSWEDIARELQMSRQSAWQRWQHLDVEED